MTCTYSEAVLSCYFFRAVTCNSGSMDFFWRRAPQQKLRTHRSFKAYYANPVMKMKRKMISFFLFLWGSGGLESTGDNRSTRGKTCPRATFYATNPTWTDPGSNPGVRGGRPATNRLSHGTAYQWIFCLWNHNLGWELSIFAVQIFTVFFFSDLYKKSVIRQGILEPDASKSVTS
jgi:hypothetical protein